MMSQNYTTPSQNDARLNLNRAGEEPAKPQMPGWRQYDPSRVTREYEFLLKDVLKAEELSGKVEGYDDIPGNFAKVKSFEPMAAAMHSVSHKGDRDPVKMRVVSDEADKRHIETFLPPFISGSDGSEGLHARFSKEGWTNISSAKEYGGQGLPHGFTGAITEMSMAANPGYTVLEFLSKGVIAAMESKGSEELKREWLPRLNNGSFTGAMVMTEPKFGSELVNVETTFQLGEDGQTGKMYGYKRYLSSADHDATLGKQGERQIVHMVLARTADKDGNLLMRDKEGVFPQTAENAGRKGKPALTLVLVPRVLLDKDGNYVDENGHKTDKPNTNNVRAAKLNDKMGLEVQSNTDAAYDGSKGFVVGKVGDGLKNMFVIMNEARIGVGLQGTAIAEATRQNVERYTAEERKQGPAGFIMNYPDVQKNVLDMRAAVDAGRSIAADVGMAVDKTLHAKKDAYTPEELKETQRYVDVMTPLVKWGLTEKGDAAVDAGQQMMGGAGYMREWGIAQNRADVRISRIYEGANGLLAVALVGTQLQNMDAFMDKIQKDMKTLNADPAIKDITDPLNDQIRTFEKATRWMKATGLQARKEGAESPAAHAFQAAATEYVELMYGVAAGAALAKNAHVAQAKLDKGGLDLEETGFLESKVATARYYTNAILANEREMHYSKMTQNAQFLELPDHGLVAQSRNLVGKGKDVATRGVVWAHDKAEAWRERLENAKRAHQGRGK